MSKLTPLPPLKKERKKQLCAINKTLSEPLTIQFILLKYFWCRGSSSLSNLVNYITDQNTLKQSFTMSSNNADDWCKEMAVNRFVLHIHKLEHTRATHPTLPTQSSVHIHTHPPSHIHMHGETYLRYLEFQFIPLQRWIASFHYSCSSIDQCTKTLGSKLVRTKYCQQHEYKMVWTITRYAYNIQNKLIALTTT